MLLKITFTKKKIKPYNLMKVVQPQTILKFVHRHLVLNYNII